MQLEQQRNYLLFHSLFHGSLVLLLALSLGAVFSASLRFQTVQFLTLTVLMTLLIVSQLGSPQEEKTAHQASRDIIVVVLGTALLYSSQVLASWLGGTLVLVPSWASLGYYSGFAFFVLLESLTLGQWLQRLELYKHLEQSTLTLQETLRQEQNVVGRLWSQIKDQARRNLWLVFLGMAFWIHAGLQEGLLSLTLVPGIGLLFAFFRATSLVHAWGFEHRLFELGLRLPREQSPRDWFFLWSLLVMGALALVLPWRGLFGIPRWIWDRLIDFLAWLAQFFSTDMAMVIQALEGNSMGERMPEPTEPPQYLAPATTSDLAYLVPWIQGIVGGLLLFFLVIRPAFIHRKRLVEAVKNLWKSLTRGFGSLFRPRKGSTGTQRLTLGRDRQNLERLIRLASRRDPAQKAWRSRVIKAYARIMHAAVERGLRVESYDTCASLESRIVGSFPLGEAQLVALREVTALFLQDVYGRHPLGDQDARLAEAQASAFIRGFDVPGS